MERAILHCDMNNFYASVECMLNPELRDKPIAVCGKVEERHGIVLAKNYLAKSYDVKTGESVMQAKAKCPKLEIVDPHRKEYKKYSRLARDIYWRFTDLVEGYGDDESFLDVTASRWLFGTGEEIAHKIREQVKFELGLTISVGVSFNKVFAKLGSDLKKPDAVTCITQDGFREQIWGLPANNMLGVGDKTEKILRQYGINTIGDLAAAPDDLLARKFGISGPRMKRHANGEDYSKVMDQDFNFPIKSIGKGNTFLKNLVNDDEVWPMLLSFADNICHRLRAAGKMARGVSLIVKCPDLSWKGWQSRLERPTQNALDITGKVFEIFQRNYPWVKMIRALYVIAINLCDDYTEQQIHLFDDCEKLKKKEIIDKSVDEIRSRYGWKSIRSAALLNLPKMPNSDEDIEMLLPTGIHSLLV